MVEVKYDEFGTKMINDSANITFKCPNCGDIEISRSRNGRDQSKEYNCPKCHFVGP